MRTELKDYFVCNNFKNVYLFVYLYFGCAVLKTELEQKVHLCSIIQHVFCNYLVQKSLLFFSKHLMTANISVALCLDQLSMLFFFKGRFFFLSNIFNHCFYLCFT